MRKLVLTATAVALAVSGCGGGAKQASPQAKAAEQFNAALTEVTNPSDKKGGTLRLANTDDWDSLDPGDTYYGYSWNFARLYGRALMMSQPAPGSGGLKHVPDLAEAPGVSSDGGKTWTYRLREGVKFEDGTPVTSKDVKYAVLRSTDSEILRNGPRYFASFLDLQGYRGPYKDKGKDTKAIETPDDRTVVFHLKKPYGGFDYFAALPQTVPVPEAKDTGIKYREHPVATGPYKFETVQPGKQYTLVRNDQWDPATDPWRKALPDRIEVALKVNGNDMDARVLAGTLHADISGNGLQQAAVGKVLGNPQMRANADNPGVAAVNYVAVNSQVPPLDNLDCRKAVIYAQDKLAWQTAVGGEVAGGQIATSLLMPGIPGYTRTDVYPAGADQHGDVAKAREHLAKCGKPDGFEMAMAYRGERPKEKAAAEATQQALARVGIKLTLKSYPAGDYFAQYAGNPPFAKQNGLGLLAMAWTCDWFDGFGCLQQLVDSRLILPGGGNTNLSIRSDTVDGLVDEALAEVDNAKRDGLWARIDKQIMDEAFVIPGAWRKVLLYRGKGVTNVFVNDAFGHYDYLAMGVE
ncbi:ABC transporter substrate-binding protein [Nonomuraea sp. NPDC050556]|uniref:ABC transporter substrate-binding protein n=1 Tax=Nonomuraea sp. NPDC050556 TaxID=3364369 RepID=UPI0037AD31CB